MRATGAHTRSSSLKAIALFVATVSFVVSGLGQTLGGNSVFNFLKLSPSTSITALGNVQPAAITADATAAWTNPALLSKQHDRHLSTSFNFFLADIKNLYAQYDHHWQRADAMLSGSINYFNYGSTTRTDARGNVMGTFKANDVAFTISASKELVPRVNTGIHVRYIQSNYGGDRSNAVSMDVGLAYTDSSGLFRMAIVARNMGQQLRTYANGIKEELPFDLQFGITKRLEHAPFQFSLAYQYMHRWDFYYNDTTFINNNQLGEAKTANFFDRLGSHLVLGVQVFPTKSLEIGIGYNFLRRMEMNMGNAGNGLSGFSGGIGVMHKQFQFRYAAGMYLGNQSFHQVSIGMNMQGKL